MATDQARRRGSACDVVCLSHLRWDFVWQRPQHLMSRCARERRVLGFDLVEISSGFVTLPVDDLVALTRRVQEAGLRAKPEVGIQFGAGGTSSV